MLRATDIHSLGEFQRDAPRYIDEIRATQNPVAITIDGEAGVVVQDARAFQRMADDLDRMRLKIALLEGEADISAGRTRDEESIFASLSGEYGLPD